MSEFVAVADETEIPKGKTMAFEIRHHRFVVAHTESGFYAVADECTHDSAPISDGKLSGDIIICRRHGARFDVTSGSVVAPPAIVPLDTYPTKVEGGKVFVLLDRE